MSRTRASARTIETRSRDAVKRFGWLVRGVLAELYPNGIRGRAKSDPSLRAPLYISLAFGRGALVNRRVVLGDVRDGLASELVTVPRNLVHSRNYDGVLCEDRDGVLIATIRLTPEGVS